MRKTRRHVYDNPSMRHRVNQGLWVAIAAGSIAITMTISAPVHAESPSADEGLTELSLDELLNIEVSVASIEPEPITQTPAVVSRYSVEQFRRLGLVSLRDILSFVPGVVTQSSNIPMDSIMIRGLWETFGQKVLLLIDDVPYWGPAHAQVPLLGLPLEAIDHIEVIRGPGAVIYGTNASAGVIKVVTKAYAGINSVSITAGANSTVNAGGYYATSIASTAEVAVGFEVQRGNGYEAFFANRAKSMALPDSQQTEGLLRERRNRTALIAKLRVGNFSMLGQWFESLESGSLGAGPTNINKPAVGENHGFLVGTKYQLHWANAKFSTYADYNVSYTEAYEENFTPGIERRVRFDNSGLDNYRVRGGATLHYKLAEGLSIFGGGEYERRSVGNYDLLIDGVAVLRQLEKTNLQEVSTFVQGDYSLYDFRFLLGARLTHNGLAGTGLTPRVAAVYTPSEHHSVKALLSVGFNSPTFLQTGVQLPFLTGNRDLRAEKIRTYDLAYTYSRSSALFVLNAYRVEASDLIARVRLQEGSPPSYQNSGRIKYHGAEADLQVHLGPAIAHANCAFVLEGNSIRAGNPDAVNVPAFTGNLGITYGFLEAHSLGTSLRYVGPRGPLGAYGLWNVDYRVRVQSAEIFGTVRNILGSASYSQDAAQFSSEGVPIFDPKLNIRVGARIRF